MLGKKFVLIMAMTIGFQMTILLRKSEEVFESNNNVVDCNSIEILSLPDMEQTDLSDGSRLEIKGHE